MSLKEPEIIDDGEKLTVAEYLAMWGCDPVYDSFPRQRGDGYHFYNYDVMYNNIEFLKNSMLPALERQLRVEDVPVERLLKPQDRDNLTKIADYLRQKIALSPLVS